MMLQTFKLKFKSKRYRSLVQQPNALCSQSEFTALQKNICLSILDLFSFDGNQKYDTKKTDEIPRSSFSLPQKIFNVNVHSSPCFPLKLMLEAFYLYAFFRERFGSVCQFR